MLPKWGKQNHLSACHLTPSLPKLHAMQGGVAAIPSPKLLLWERKRNVKKIAKSLLVIAGLAIAGSASALPLYSTSFEASEGYSVGTFPTDKAGWTATPGTENVLIQTGVAVGEQYVRLGAGSQLDYALSAQTKAQVGNVAWVEGYFRGAGSDVTLAQANYPSDQASAIVHFSNANGIEVLNGNRDGSAGTPVSTGVALGSANAGSWFRVTLRLDFAAKSWDIYVNGTKRNTAVLGFRDNVSALNGFRNLAQGGADFDAFRIVKVTAGDANGDGKLDSADFIKLIEMIATPPAGDPIAQALGDTNGDGVINAGDVESLKIRLLAMTI